ncbi:MAG: hypothetical protein AMXMBFR84_41870 [Candidatus Hydrogenedentota bacterium]
MRVTLRTVRNLTLVLLGVSLASHAQATPDFVQQIKPILERSCYPCHGPDKQKSSYRLDVRDIALRGGESGETAIVPHNAQASPLNQYVSGAKPGMQMPPADSGIPALTSEEQSLIREWINEGPSWPDALAGEIPENRHHWAFQPVTRPQPPTIDANPIDAFIRYRLAQDNLDISPEADRRTLIRRLSFDLLGLPPSAEEVEQFVSDPGGEAYAKVVERYLASPHYGERWARHWLDVARYADTKGYVYDREEVKFTHSHVYRDWVVEALNKDMPYDQFIRLQLAADAITDGASRQHLAAMGFLTLGQRFLGVMPDIIDDRIDTVTRGLMGLTVSCARCHDHKFDPFPTADYYSLYGVFSASSERTVPLNPAELDDARNSAFMKEMKSRESKLREIFTTRSRELEVRLRAQVERYLAEVPNADQLPTDDFYQILSAEDINPTMVRRWASYIQKRGNDDSIFGAWNRLASLPAEEFGSGVLSILAELNSFPTQEKVVFAVNDSGAKPSVNASVLAALSNDPPGSFDEVAARYGALFQSVNDEWLAALQASELNDTATPTRLSDPNRESIRQLLYDDGSPVRVPNGAIVDLEWMFDEPVRVELAKLYAEIDRWIITADGAPSYAVVLVDKPDAPMPRIFKRGNPAMPGTPVPRQFLELISGPNRKPFTAGSGRLEMAEAIASKNNPMTARVMVNRIWAWHFGKGLVSTPSDFGTRSNPPSHPELLDWLAAYLMDHEWSLKALHRQIVLSKTYRQSSMAPPDDNRVERATRLDPENKLLWKYDRRRLEFEAMRDALLMASGEIDLNLGGRPVDLTAEPFNTKRTLYGRVDRQFLPPVYRNFDFPSPDMHSPQRPGTTVPQQALYLMNNAFIQGRARALAARTESTSERERVERFYECVYQRAPSQDEVLRSLAFIASAEASTPPPAPPQEPSAWSYGYGKLDAASGMTVEFTPLPHFTGSAWQGGPAWPDGATGWAQLTAEGGHPGNDLDHAVIRRWTAPVAGKVNISGRIVHARTEGDGIVARIVSSRSGTLGVWYMHNTSSDSNLFDIAVEAGDAIDFMVDIREVLNSDEHLWAPVVTLTGTTTAWDARKEFAGPYEAPPLPLNAWEKFAQVLLSSNEFLFVD